MPKSLLPSSSKLDFMFAARTGIKRLIQLLFLILLFRIESRSQDYFSLAKQLQAEHKESEVAILNSDVSYSFQSAKTLVTVAENKNEKLLSLRYNEPFTYFETESGESTIESFSAVNSSKVKVSDAMRYCGKYTQDGYFYDDSRVCYQKLPLKELGEIWDVSVMTKIKDGKYLTAVYFEGKYPTIAKKITFNVPKGIEVELKEFNFTGYNITRTEQAKGNIKTIVYECKNLPRYASQPYARGIQYNHPHLLVLLKSMEIDGVKKPILSSTKDLYTWYHSLTTQLKPNHQVLSPVVKDLIKGKTTDEDKMKAIYYWVQNNVRYIAFEDGLAGFKPDEAHNVFEKKYGDCKGMANLTKEMLKLAGYNARLTWIGTKKIMYDYSIPSLAVDNHMICTVLLGDKKYFLDATEKYMPLGFNAERIQDRPVMIEDGDNFILDRIPSDGKNSNLEVKQYRLALNNENLSGTCEVTLKGESKKNFLYAYHYTKTENKEKLVSNFFGKDNNVKINSVELPDMEERSGDLSLKCKYSSSEGVSLFNNEYYIDVDSEKLLKNFDVKKERVDDIDFGEKIFRKYVVELDIPKGYKVSHLPEHLDISNPEFAFHINYKLEGNKIKYTKEIIIEKGIIQRSSFEKWNASIKELNKFYEKQVILSK